MSNLSRSQEREERTKMGRGMLTSVFALLFSWVPVLGLLLASIGFVKVAVRLTNRYRTRYAVYFAVTLLILALCTGVLLAEVYLYSGNPNIVSDTGMWLFTKLTGETSLPGAGDAQSLLSGTDYTGMDVPGMGLDPALYGDSDVTDIDPTAQDASGEVVEEYEDPAATDADPTAQQTPGGVTEESGGASYSG